MTTPTIKADYYFRMRSPAILSTGYRATLMAVLDYETASMMQSDLISIHAQVFPDLPSGTPTQARDLTYYRLRTPSGENRIIASAWLQSTPELISDLTITIVIPNMDVTAVGLIRDLLIANGINGFAISQS